MAIVMTLTALNFSTPYTSAQPCPDIGVVFARGTSEPPGVGSTGQAFIDSLRAQAVPRTVGVHAVNYPASGDFFGPGFTLNLVDGIRDVLDHIRGVVSVCPQTQMIIGGYSQGAMVSAFATSDVLPGGVPPDSAPIPLPAEVADHVAAIVLFGKPNGMSLAKYKTSAVGASRVYASKLLELCAPGDSVCSADPAAPVDLVAHGRYASNGMTGSGAAFAVSRLPVPPLP
ncbi:cutinase family protein [Mycolicibacterium palauense]|uniref:cutinase family protein n=1 Tax=Mycolicibacterium palauense TaxID=2034511 RepID=UPI001FE5851C|nr:cutinase family protein [Mycolicibacterium palauense]